MENNDAIVLFLAFIITGGITYNDISLKESEYADYSLGVWIPSYGVVFLIILLMFSGLLRKINIQVPPNIMNVATLFFIVYMTSILIQQWELNGHESKGLCKSGENTARNISISTTRFDSHSGRKTGINPSSRYVYMLAYGISLILLMIICLMRFDQGNNFLPWTAGHKNLEFGLILAFPILLPLLTESISWLAVNNLAREDEFTPEYAFSHFIGGGSDDKDIFGRYIVGYIFLLFLIIVLVANSTGGFNGSFTLFGSNNSNWPTSILLFILVFFGIIMRLLFLQDCSIEEIKEKKDTENDNSPPCNISKYGGVTTLIMISLITLYIYNVKGLKDKLYAIILMGSFTFGLSELFIRLKNK